MRQRALLRSREENSRRPWQNGLMSSDQKLALRAIINRLKRWSAMDSFASVQEPAMREEFQARAAITALLAELMDAKPGRTWHEAFTIFQAAANSQATEDRAELRKAVMFAHEAEKDPGIFQRPTARPPREPTLRGIQPILPPRYLGSDDDPPPGGDAA
jgi:hypothetical protein